MGPGTRPAVMSESQVTVLQVLSGSTFRGGWVTEMGRKGQILEIL